MRTLVLTTLFVFSLFAAQLVRIQGFDAASVSKAALKERLGSQTIPALRGEIIDSNGVVLASSEERLTISVDQTAVCTYKTGLPACEPARSEQAVKDAATALSPALGVPVDTLIPQLTGTLRYRIIAKDVSPLVWRKVNALQIPGVYNKSDDRIATRNYPQGTTSASLVGFVLNDGKAGGGLELMANKVLAGKNGHQEFERAAEGQAIPDGLNKLTPAVPGRAVQLTINSNIQWYAQNALAQEVTKTEALSGTVVVQEVRTGKLLAVASYPTFDPNNVGKATGSLSNLAFTDVFEPGSTGKVITMSAALSEGTVTPMTPVVIPSKMHRSDRWFHDAEPHGVEYRTVAGALAQSSNMGTMLIGETVSAKVLESYMRRFGLGATSGTGFPGESPGLLASSADWNGSQRYTVMFGQGVSVTAIQATAVYQAIANGGLRIPPTLVQAVADDKGNLVPAPEPKGTRAISPAVAGELSQMLEGVVSKDGTAPAAQIEGYRVAGKTGTANRAVNGVYSGLTASFIGYAPADKPQIVVSVILQRPIRGSAGGVVAAPVFHDVMTYALQEMKIPPTGTKAPALKIALDGPPSPTEPKVLRDEHPYTGR